MKLKNYVFALLTGLLTVSCSKADNQPIDGGLPPSVVSFANFETYNSTPYFFRYGNQDKSGVQGGIKVVDFYPRWAYSHTVIDNPLLNDANSSSKVLEYTSLEVRNFGIKFRFPKSLKVGNVRGISFQIYQPANVIGKATWQNEPKATSQQLAVKLLSRFNAVNDCLQEKGVLLTNSITSFTEEGEWRTYTFSFSEEEYKAATSELSNGIAGLVIIPTYGSGTTLAKENIYKCYIDNIQILQTN